MYLPISCNSHVISDELGLSTNTASDSKEGCLNSLLSTVSCFNIFLFALSENVRGKSNHWTHFNVIISYQEFSVIYDLLTTHIQFFRWL